MGILKAYCILPHQLYQRGEFVQFSREEKREFLSAWGVTCVVSLYGPYDLDLSERLRNFFHPGGYRVRYIHYPIADGKHVEMAPLEKLADGIVFAIRQDECVLVSCHAGRNRSGLLSTLIVRQLLHLSGAEALAFVRERRPRAVANEVFIEYLEALPTP